jgi:hypothetical protein
VYVLSCDPSGTSKILPLCVAFVKVTSPSDKLTGASPRVVTSVIAPVEEFLLILRQGYLSIHKKKGSGKTPL